MSETVCYFDASSYPRIRRSCISGVIEGTVTEKYSKEVDYSKTIHLLELKALVELVDRLISSETKGHVKIYGDNSSVVGRANGHVRIRDKHVNIKRRYEQLQIKLNQLDSYEIIWIPRSKNELANSLCKLSRRERKPL